MPKKSKTLYVLLEEELLEKFEAKIEKNNKKLGTNNLNKSTVIRNLIAEYIKKDLVSS